MDLQREVSAGVTAIVGEYHDRAVGYHRYCYAICCFQVVYQLLYAK